jgi:4-hydroxybenzoate polyprenyltransferase
MPPALASLRPRQWIKNLAVFAGLAFSGQAGNMESICLALHAFITFCLASSAIYLYNDLLDKEKDLLHPIKRHRPIASGQLSSRNAITMIAILAVLAFLQSLQYRPLLPAIGGYFFLQVLYCHRLKHIVILDVFCIATGFLLRVLAGVWVLNVPLSPWLVACGVQLALFLALCKRRAELTQIGRGEQRPLLEAYDNAATDIMISVVASATVVTYALYTLLPGALGTLAPELESRAGEPGMVWTLPFVLYGVMRYLWLVYREDRGQRPEKLLTTDFPLFGAVLGYLAVIAWVVYL